MNELIRELAERTGLAEAADVRGGYIYPEGMEKFAELIVRQCMEVVEEHGGMCGAASAKKLADYFGIQQPMPKV